MTGDLYVGIGGWGYLIFTCNMVHGMLLCTVVFYQDAFVKLRSICFQRFNFHMCGRS